MTGGILPEPPSSDALAVDLAVHRALRFMSRNIAVPSRGSGRDLIATAALLAFIAGIQGENLTKRAHLKGLQVLTRERHGFDLRHVLGNFLFLHGSTTITPTTRREVCEYLVSLPECLSLQNPKEDAFEPANTPTLSSTPVAGLNTSGSVRDQSSHQNRDFSVEPYAAESEYWTALESISGSQLGSPWSERDGLLPPYALSESGLHSYESRFESIY